jgi:Dirigent-like protein
MNTTEGRKLMHTISRTTRLRSGAAAIVLGVVAMTALTGSGSEAKAQHGQVLRFGLRFSPFDVIDVPPLQTHPGDYRAGDYTVFSDTLVNRKGRPVGTEAGTGTISRVDDTGAQIYYSMAIQVRGGQITASGLGTPDPRKLLAVTGGTGSFVGARGSVHVVENGDDTGTLTITLR